jgi:hypothetical protein
LVCTFVAWNISLHSFLAFRVSAEKSAIILISLPLYVTWRYSLAAFNTSFVLHACHFNYNMMRRGFLVMYTWGFKCLLHLDVHIFCWICEIFCYNFID